MSNPSSWTGDDLIIITDETPVEIPAMSENPLWDVLSQTSSLAPAPEITLETPTISIETSNIDEVSGGLDLSNLSIDTTEQQVIKEETSEIIETPLDTVPQMATLSNEVSTEVKNDIPVVEASQTIQQDVVEDVNMQSTSSSDDMDGILAETIWKLKKRQANVASIKTSKLTQIDSLNSQVEKLKSQVTVLKEEVDTLDNEDAKIEANVASLENMKMSTIPTMDAKDYAQKRVVKRTPVKV